MVSMKEKITLFAISLIAGLIWPITAFADPVTVAVVAGAAAGASAYYIAGATLTAALVYAAGTAALTYYSASQAADIPDFSSSSFGSTATNRTQMVKQAITNRRVIYGTSKVSGPLVFMQTTASDDILHLVVAIAGHEIDGFEKFYINDEEVTLDGDPTTGIRNVNSTKYNGDVKIEAFLGTDSQAASSTLVSEVSGWTTDHRLRGVAYFYARLNHNTTDFPQGIPQIRCIVRGKKVFDPRTNTTGFTDNPALIFNDYLKDSTYGLACADAEVDEDAIIAGANLADEIQDLTAVSAQVSSFDLTNNTVTTSDSVYWRTGDRVRVSSDGTQPNNLYADTDYYAVAFGTHQLGFAATLANARAGSKIDLTNSGSGNITITRNGEPRYTVNGTIDSEEKPKSVIAKMLTAQGASMAYSGGKFVMIPAKFTEPTLEFDEDDLRSGLQVSPKTGRRDRFNTVKGVIADPSNEWQPTDYPPFTSTQYATDDGETIFQDVAFEYCISPTMAQRLAKIVLLDSRQEMLVNASMKLTGLQAQIGDIIRLSNDRFGFAATTRSLTISASTVSTTDNSFTFASDHGLKDGEVVKVSSDVTMPTGITANTSYRVIKVSDTVIKLAATFADALDDTAISITAIGAGDLTFTKPSKAFRVIEFQFAPSKEGDSVYMGCDLTLKECDDSVYDFDTSEETTLDPAPNTTLPSPFTQNKPPTNLVLESGNDALRVSTTGTVDVRIEATWDAPINSFTLFYELEYKPSSQSNWQSVVVSSAATSYYISGVTEGVQYDVRVRAVNSMGVKSEYVTVTAHTVIGKTEPPPDVQSFAVSVLANGTRRFTFSTANFPADVSVGGGVRIRQSSDINEVWGNMTDVGGLITTSPFETATLAAGSYRFAIRMENSSGVQSDNPLYITATLDQRPVTDSILSRNEQDLNWSGSYTNAWVTPENTLSSTATEDWSDLPATWADLEDSWAALVGSNSSITYETLEIDLGQEYVFTTTVTVNGTGTSTVTWKTGSENDGGVTGSYGSVTNADGVRYIQIKVVQSGTAPIIESINIDCSATFLEQDYTNINTATYTNANFSKISTGRFRIATTQDVSIITRASLAVTSGGALFYNVISKTETVNGNPAAEFLIFDSSETPTDATVDISLRGPKAPT